MTSATQPPTRLSAEQIRALDPYALMGALGKRVIHPGGRRATERLLDWADITAGERVLDAGCGVATTAIEIVRRHDATVTALDIAPVMLERARHNVHRAGLAERVGIDEGDVEDLPYPDATFDCVLAEAVTMFVDRSRAARELVRVCRPGGRVLATEFYWLRPPTDEVHARPARSLPRLHRHRRHQTDLSAAAPLTPSTRKGSLPPGASPAHARARYPAG